MKIEDFVRMTANADARLCGNMRLGQVLFNALWQVDREAADSVTGTEVDPFHRDDRVKDFLVYLLEHEVNEEEPAKGCGAGSPMGAETGQAFGLDDVARLRDWLGIDGNIAKETWRTMDEKTRRLYVCDLLLLAKEADECCSESR